MFDIFIAEDSNIKDKIEAFSHLGVEDRMTVLFNVLYESRDRKVKEELLDSISSSDILRLIQEAASDLNPEDRSEKVQHILSLLSKNRIMAVYREASRDDKRILKEEVKSMHDPLAEQIVQDKQNVTNLTNRISRSDKAIDKAKADIKSERNTIKLNRQKIRELKHEKRIVNNKRRRLAKKYQRQLLKRQSRFRTIRRKQIEKREKTKKALDDVTKIVNKKTASISRLYSKNVELNLKLASNKNLIRRKKKLIKKDRKRIRSGKIRIKEKTVLIRELDRAERAMFSRREYKENVRQRQHFSNIIGNEAPENVVNTPETPAAPAEPVQPHSEEQQREQSAPQPQQPVPPVQPTPAPQENQDELIDEAPHTNVNNQQQEEHVENNDPQTSTEQAPTEEQQREPQQPAQPPQNAEEQAQKDARLKEVMRSHAIPVIVEILAANISSPDKIDEELREYLSPLIARGQQETHEQIKQEQEKTTQEQLDGDPGKKPKGFSRIANILIILAFVGVMVVLAMILSIK